MPSIESSRERPTVGRVPLNMRDDEIFSVRMVSAFAPAQSCLEGCCLSSLLEPKIRT